MAKDTEMIIEGYHVVIEGGRRNYSAYSTDLAGVYSTGKTIEETAQHMREAIPLHIEGLIEDGQLVPDPNQDADPIATPPKSLAHHGV